MVGDGGGNDILIPAIAFNSNGCKTRWWQRGLSDDCRELIDSLYVEGVDFLNEVAESGVESGILTGYYYTKNSLVSGNLDDLEEAVDYGDKKLKKACQNSAAAITNREDAAAGTSISTQPGTASPRRTGNTAGTRNDNRSYYPCML